MTRVWHVLALMFNFVACAPTQAIAPRTADTGKAVSARELVVEALVDGDTELHLVPGGIFWVSGRFAKPGRHEGRNEPTFVNGVAWYPAWQEPQCSRGADRSEVFPVHLGSSAYDFEVTGIAEERGKDEKESRSPVMMCRSEGEQILSIPDLEASSRWYTIRFFAPTQN